MKALAYEEQLKLVREELEKSITAPDCSSPNGVNSSFDNTTKCLNQTRWVTATIEEIKDGGS